ncbi:hypothetical protein [Sphingomonas sp. MMS24-J13]|uniref:hypothetical protein n=1 Tax=Sphingomonas sp. MMS24-J13 TaxID=3238686 RepID=UPI00384F3D19
MTAAIGLRAQKGGCVAVGLAIEHGQPRILISTLIQTHRPGDRLSFEPFAVAAGMARDEAAAAVAEGRARQDRLAADGLQALADRLAAAGCRPTVAALLINRAGWITDLLDYSRAWTEHGPVAEGLAVREALRFGVRETGTALIEQDEKALPAYAAAVLGLAPAGIDARLKALGETVGRPWRKEQKLACLAAWVALVRDR